MRCAIERDSSATCLGPPYCRPSASRAKPSASSLADAALTASSSCCGHHAYYAIDGDAKTDWRSEPTFFGIPARFFPKDGSVRQVGQVGCPMASLFAFGTKFEHFLRAKEVTLSFHLLQVVGRLREVLEPCLVEVELVPPEGGWLRRARALSNGAGARSTTTALTCARCSTLLLLSPTTLTGG